MNIDNLQLFNDLQEILKILLSNFIWFFIYIYVLFLFLDLILFVLNKILQTKIKEIDKIEKKDWASKKPSRLARILLGDE